MVSPRGLISVLRATDEGFAKQLDDTLLNRLEYALYCEDNCHTEFWDNFDTDGFYEIIKLLKDNLEESELSRGKLKIIFSVVWRMRKCCTLSSLRRITGLFCSVILSKKFSIISSLHNFLHKNVYGSNPLNIFNDMVSLDFSVLKDGYQKSSSVNCRRSLILVFILLLRSNLQANCGNDFEILDKRVNLLNTFSVDVSFLIDLFTELTRLYLKSNDGIWYEFLKRSTEKILSFLNINEATMKSGENYLYLLILLSPYYSNSLDSATAVICSSYTGCYLRRLIANEVFQDSPLHRALVSTWYNQVESSLVLSINTPFPRALMSLFTCQKDFLQYPAFRDLLPPEFIENIWKYCMHLLSYNENTIVLQNIWSLFNRYCHLLPDSCKKDKLDCLLSKFQKQPESLGEFSVLLDCVSTLYFNLSSLTSLEQMDVFHRVYDLAHGECSRLKCSGGCLSYSFLLLKIYQPSFANETVSLQLLKLQHIVSQQIAEEPLLVANEAVIEIHRGFFITPLLRSQIRDVFSPQFCLKTLELVQHLDQIKEAISDEQVFPSTLKGVLLACLFRCLGNSTVVENLRNTERYQLALQVCSNLGSAEWEEDALIRRWIDECWVDFSKVMLPFSLF